MTTPSTLAAELKLHQLVAEMLWRAGCRTVEAARAFLDPQLYKPASPFALPDMARAAGRLHDAIAAGEHIRVWGDFDVDGQTATSVLLLGLRRLGARVDFTIPDRAIHSHGLNLDGIRQAAADGVRVLLTCDCGIAEHDAVRAATAAGLDVIVSDHHDLLHAVDGAADLPQALAVVNPKRLAGDHALAQLPGVGVAYKIVEALSSECTDLLDLVALGIVSDVAIQRGDTRYLLQRGLEQLRRAPRIGIRQLMQSAGIDPQHFDSDSIGFQVGPRLNAAGRLATADLAVELLTTDDPARAEAIASHIEQLNAQRRELQKQVESEVSAMIEGDPALARQPVIVLHGANWPASVIGIVASALTDRYERPAILIAVAPGQIGRASARSVEGIDIHAAISAQDTLIEGGGGHPMAAGFGIRPENIARFAEAVGAHVVQQIALQGAETAARESADTDFTVAWREANLELAEQIDRLAPFGAGNPRPVLRSSGLRFVRAEPLGKDGKHQAIYLADESNNIGRAAWWRSAHLSVPEADEAVQLRYRLRRDVYRDKARAQIEVVALQRAEHTAKPAPGNATAPVFGRRFAIVDMRGELRRDDALHKLLEAYGADQVRVWKAGASMTPGAVLSIWDAPPSPEALRELLAEAQPGTVVLLSAPVAATADSLDQVYAQILGMLKTAQQRGDAHDDAAVLARMARRINQRPETVRAAIAVQRGESGARARLSYLLEETRAYRRYFQTASADAVLAQAG